MKPSQFSRLDAMNHAKNIAKSCLSNIRILCASVVQNLLGFIFKQKSNQNNMQGAFNKLYSTMALFALAALLSPAQAEVICNKYCDGQNQNVTRTERLTVTKLNKGRSLVLHVNDDTAMVWGAIEDGVEGDSVWLDRSFDGGITWADGSVLGRAWITSGRRGARTLMYNVDDWKNQRYGALRVCGQVESVIACTNWGRSNWNAWSPSTAAATALMMSYNNQTGLFNNTQWWTTATAMTSLINNIQVSKMPSFKYAIDTTFRKNVQKNDGHVTFGRFRTVSSDDTGWWAMTWMHAYDVTGDLKYLNVAKIDADWMHTFWDNKCGGGVNWDINIKYKNAISNNLYIQVNAALHNRLANDTVYLQRAQAGWEWFKKSGMINSAKLINDGLTDACTNNNDVTWTYNQGTILAALTELYKATNNQSYLASARELANASTTHPSLHVDGILTEPCEAVNKYCDQNAQAFKGIYIRSLSALNKVLPDHPYTEYIRRQALSAYKNNRNPLDQYGIHWAGVFDNANPVAQASALDLMNAVTAP